MDECSVIGSSYCGFIFSVSCDSCGIYTVCFKEWWERERNPGLGWNYSTPRGKHNAVPVTVLRLTPPPPESSSLCGLCCVQLHDPLPTLTKCFWFLKLTKLTVQQKRKKNVYVAQRVCSCFHSTERSRSSESEKILQPLVLFKLVSHFLKEVKRCRSQAKMTLFY